jgi:hypothetical protein
MKLAVAARVGHILWCKCGGTYPGPHPQRLRQPWLSHRVFCGSSMFKNHRGPTIQHLASEILHEAHPRFLGVLGPPKDTQLFNAGQQWRVGKGFKINIVTSWTPGHYLTSWWIFVDKNHWFTLWFSSSMGWFTLFPTKIWRKNCVFYACEHEQIPFQLLSRPIRISYAAHTRFHHWF